MEEESGSVVFHSEECFKMRITDTCWTHGGYFAALRCRDDSNQGPRSLSSRASWMGMGQQFFMPARCSKREGVEMEVKSNLRRAQSLKSVSTDHSLAWTEAGLRDRRKSVSQLVAQ
ncbi:hypothetical protein SRHO_G00278510 [Serrasalmus rhombeus]